MKQYLDLLKAIKEKGTYKSAARPGMPGTQSLFGYQFRHNLAKGFPLLTTKKVSFKNIVVELLWFLRGDTNIKYLVDNGCNIWNSDAYNYYCKKMKELDSQFFEQQRWFPVSLEEFMTFVKEGEESSIPNYTFGDCGFQYGGVWRKWEIGLQADPKDLDTWVQNPDQIKTLIEGLLKTPESRRHIVTAIDPAHDQDLALYWCHALFQFNCRPLTLEERKSLIKGDFSRVNKEGFSDIWKSLPKYYLDCQLYQRSADSVLGVPYNIASYALLTHIIAKICNMIPGEFIHSFGDVHIYDNHKEAVAEQLTREPKELPKLVFQDEFHYLCECLSKNKNDIEGLLAELKSEMFKVGEYNPYPPIKAELSTGTV